MIKKILTAVLLLMALTASAQVDKYLESHVFVGTLNGKTPVEIAWQTTNDGRMAGYIYYPNASSPAPILVVGHNGKQSEPQGAQQREPV